MKDKIKVYIEVTRTVTYGQTVEMDRSEFERLDRDREGDNWAKARKEINSLVDDGDWVDDELESIEEFEEVKGD